MEEPEYDYELIEIAHKLKDAYRACYLKKHNGKYKLNKRVDNIDAWMATAKTVRRIKADPEDYIKANFKYRKEPHIPVNTLHGPTAEKCYRRAQIVAGIGGASDEQVEEEVKEDTYRLPPSQIDILSRIADLQYFLVCNHYDKNLLDLKTRNYVLTRIPGLLDPLAVMLLSPDSEMFAVYGERAKEILDEDSCLKQAMKELGFTAALNYLIGNE